MMKRINPNLVIIRGNYIKGIYGNLIFVDFNSLSEDDKVLTKEINDFLEKGNKRYGK